MEHGGGRALEGSQWRLGDSDSTRAVVSGRTAILPICRGGLVLSRRAVKARARRRSHSLPRHAAPARVPSAESTEVAAAEESISRDAGSRNGATSAPAQPLPKMARRTCKNKDGLPEGWVIDEEGYVVPRHG
jgi:hypothetical protein